MSEATVAMSSDFLTSYSNLPRRRQGRVMNFIDKFRANPTSPGINYEKVRNAFDPNLYSVRIDDTYRGIVMRQQQTGVYLLLWVDHHDRAYEWASRKRCRVNPATGSIQVFDVQEETTEPDAPTVSEPSVFQDVTDDQLMRLGVPEEKLSETRAITSIDKLHELKPTFPADAYEGLEWVAHGFSAEEVLKNFYEAPTAERVSDDDFTTALSNPGTLRSFVIVEGEDELQAMLSAPLERWRVFLHPTQRKVVTRSFNGPARVTGGAGTGKTVVAMHRAKWLASQTEPGERILFTTFTRNLADDIQYNLRKICSSEEMRKIEVVNLDRWVHQFLRESEYDYRIVYGAELAELWSEALSLSGEPLDFPIEFYQDEWSKVILAHEVLTLPEYARATRRGRGVQLHRKNRMSVWNVVEEFRNLCAQKRVRDVEMAMYECRKLIEKRYNEPLYSSIIVDEGQDFGPSAYRLLRAMAGHERPNDLFIVGDAHQRIYRNRAVLSHCGVNIRGRSSYLRINYRTTEEIRRWAFGLLKGISFDDLDDGYDDGHIHRSLTHGPRPVVKSFASVDGEFDHILKEIQSLQEQGTSLEDVCIVARTNRLLDDYIRRFLQNDIRTYEIKRSTADDRSQEGVRLATMHRVKGLEFEHVFVVAVNDQHVPHPLAIAVEDQVSLDEAITAERSLLYVALTRARQTAHVTSYAAPSRFLSEVEESLTG